MINNLLPEWCQERYGYKIIAINMHMHIHLAECILDCGSFYSFWCTPMNR